MDYSTMTDEELLQQVSGLHNADLNSEWFRRHGMNIPYRLDIYGRILNCFTMKIVADSACDKLIARQADHVRVLRQLGK